MLNIDKDIWGPLLWSIMHILSTKYKYNLQYNLFTIIYKKYIPTIIPCKECLSHYNSFINSIKITNINFELNLYKFHNEISIRIGKKPNYNYNALNRQYSIYGLDETIILLNKLKKYYYMSGYNNMANNISNLINFLIFNFF